MRGRRGGNAERTGEMGELGDLAWLSETWVPILVRKRKKSFIINVAVSMEGNPALAPPYTPTLAHSSLLRKVFWNTLREMRTEAE